MGGVGELPWERGGEERSNSRAAEQTAAKLAGGSKKGCRGCNRGTTVGGRQRESTAVRNITAGAAVIAACSEAEWAAAMRECQWDRQHGWLHSPEGRAADRREAEQELARVVAALRVWHAATAAAAPTAAAPTMETAAVTAVDRAASLCILPLSLLGSKECGKNVVVE